MNRALGGIALAGILCMAGASLQAGFEVRAVDPDPGAALVFAIGSSEDCPNFSGGNLRIEALQGESSAIDCFEVVVGPQDSSGYDINLKLGDSEFSVSAGVESDALQQVTSAGVAVMQNIYWDDPPDSTKIFLEADSADLQSGQHSASITVTVSNHGTPDDNIEVLLPSNSALIPVVYTGSTSSPKWVIADTQNQGTTDASGSSLDWYSYENHIWGNGVTVMETGSSGTSRAQYQSAAAGTEVKVSDILGNWVYLPRFRYQTWTFASGSTPQRINIQFEDCNAQAGVCTSPSYSKASIDQLQTPGQWLTHPAFTKCTAVIQNAQCIGGDWQELDGIWIAKYEITGASLANLTVLPLQAHVNGVTAYMQLGTLANAFRTTMADNHGVDRADMQMINDDAWGAMAYLAQSNFGICTNSSCTYANGTIQKVWNNGYSSNGAYSGTFATGYGPCGTAAAPTDASSATCTQPWYNDIGILASTSGNQSGIYDAAGAAWEYVMGNYGGTGSTGTYTAASSGISSMPAGGEIFPLMASNQDGYSLFNQTVKWGIGKAFFETNTWMGDYHASVGSGTPWSFRGGVGGDGGMAGIFSFAGDAGGARTLSTTRPSISVG